MTEVFVERPLASPRSANDIPCDSLLSLVSKRGLYYKSPPIYINIDKVQAIQQNGNVASSRTDYLDYLVSLNNIFGNQRL